MQLIKAHKIRVYPNNSQETFFKKACGVSRFTYNHALNEWQVWYAFGWKPTPMKLKKAFNYYRNDLFPWMSETHRDAYAQAFTNVGTAFQKFFTGKGKYPTFKKKNSKDSFYIANDQFRLDDNKIRIPKLGFVRMAEALRFEGKINSATVSREADKWFVSVSVVIEIHEPVRKPSTVGIDVGIKPLAFLSNGESFTGPKAHKSLLGKLRFLNKKLSRQVKGSNNWKKTVVKLGRLYARIKNIRLDYTHKLTSYIANNFGTVGIEELNIAGMIKNRKLARSIMDCGWHALFRQLEYKLKAAGGKLVKVDRFFPSTKLCMDCGQLHDMPLHKRVFTCDCGVDPIDRDLHAAQNIERFAVGSTV